jgi:hypothetical protein
MAAEYYKRARMHAAAPQAARDEADRKIELIDSAEQERVAREARRQEQTLAWQREQKEHFARLKEITVKPK